MMQSKKNSIKHIIGLGALLLSLPAAHALEAMDDHALSKTTGQDGISVGIGVDQVTFKQTAWIDQDGIAEPVLDQNYQQAAGVVVGGINNNPVKVTFLGQPQGATTVKAVIDAADVNGQPVMNIGVNFAEQIQGIRVSPFALYLAGRQAVSDENTTRSIFNAGGSLNTGVQKFLQVGSDAQNFEINLNSSAKPYLNIQLGNVPQGFMVVFGGSIQAICGTGEGCPITLVSGDTGASTIFQAVATDRVNGFSLNGFHAGIENTGLVIGNSGQSSKMDMHLKQVTLGNSGATRADVFNGLPNGSMGSFGAIGGSVKDLKVTIKGL